MTDTPRLAWCPVCRAVRKFAIFESERIHALQYRLDFLLCQTCGNGEPAKDEEAS